LSSGNSRFVLARTVFAFCPAPALRLPTAKKLKLAGLPNGGKVTDLSFAGRQPHTEGIEQLKKLGITIVVDLRGENPELIEKERRQNRIPGMRFVNIPSAAGLPPQRSKSPNFCLSSPAKRKKVFVHCRFGDDRTGVFVRRLPNGFRWLARPTGDGKMYFFGFNGFWHPAMKSYIRDFPSKTQNRSRPLPFRKQKCSLRLPA